MYTISEVSKSSGVSIKVLYYYHKIGILKPAKIGENGYRYYSENELNRLQQIQFYRTFDMSLKEIAKLLSTSQENHLIFLKKHRAELEQRKAELSTIIQTLDKTILKEEKKKSIPASAMFDGLKKEIKFYDPYLIQQVFMMKFRFILLFLITLFATIYLTLVFLIGDWRSFEAKPGVFFFLWGTAGFCTIMLGYYVFFVSPSDETFEKMLETYQVLSEESKK